ncbi:hypothetical protein FMUND_15568 [Fusarium mundagurra]|uniref:Uncharacterized protein n=1 Tax=Fusarium mundagurra TaxID=1567541 RepID=A0A8H6CYN1_9HYPO|nr:hypothetical protein FMUND_15568 [Fusarium mundagurra]
MPEERDSESRPFFVTSVFNGTELRELLTSPPGTISFVLSTFRLREPATFRPLCPPTSRTTDFCSLGCPDDIRSILLLDIEGHRALTLTLTSACSLSLPRPTSAALAARTTQTAFGCSTFWALWCPRP